MVGRKLEGGYGQREVEKCCSRLTFKYKIRKVGFSTKHEGVFFYCDHCSYKAAYKNNLKQHVEAHHDGIHHFCDQCDYKSTNKRMLQQHIVINVTIKLVRKVI